MWQLRHVDLSCRLVCLAWHSEDPTDNARFLRFSLKLFRFFVHSNPTELAEKTNNFCGRPAILLRRIDFAAMRAITHHVLRFLDVIKRAVLAGIRAPVSMSFFVGHGFTSSAPVELFDKTSPVDSMVSAAQFSGGCERNLISSAHASVVHIIGDLFTYVR